MSRPDEILQVLIDALLDRDIDPGMWLAKRAWDDYRATFGPFGVEVVHDRPTHTDRYTVTVDLDHTEVLELDEDGLREVTANLTDQTLHALADLRRRRS